MAHISFPRKLIPLMMLNALEGRPLPIYGDGGNIRDWLYVEDHCAWHPARSSGMGILARSTISGGGNERNQPPDQWIGSALNWSGSLLRSSNLALQSQGSPVTLN
jgi:hypothetical protein